MFSDDLHTVPATIHFVALDLWNILGSKGDHKYGIEVTTHKLFSPCTQEHVLETNIGST